MGIWEREFLIQEGPEEIRSPPVDTRFEIFADAQKGFFGVNIKGGKPDPGWATAKLLERGTDDFDWSKVLLQLPPWTANPPLDTQQKYQNGVRSVVQILATASTKRLEGDVLFNKSGLLKRVIIILANNAVIDASGTSHPLLIVDIRRGLSARGGPIDDGTAHGNN